MVAGANTDCAGLGNRDDDEAGNGEPPGPFSETLSVAAQCTNSQPVPDSSTVTETATATATQSASASIGTGGTVTIQGNGAGFGQCSVQFQGDDPPVGGTCAGQGGASMRVDFLIEDEPADYRITASSSRGACLQFSGPSVAIFQCNLAASISIDQSGTLDPGAYRVSLSTGADAFLPPASLGAIDDTASSNVRVTIAP
jgi:hypothetical protein